MILRRPGAHLRAWNKWLCKGSEAVFLALAGFVLFGGSHFAVLAVAV